MPIKLFKSEFVNFQTMSLFMVFNTQLNILKFQYWFLLLSRDRSSYFMKQEWVTKCFLCVQIWLMQKFW